jgi:hypothetical protein
MKYITSLSTEECIRRLRQTRSQHPWSLKKLWTPLPKGTVECRIWGHRFLLFAWPKEYTRNSFAPVFCGIIKQQPQGAGIYGRFMLHPIVLFFLMIWFGGALFGVGLAIYHFTDSNIRGASSFFNSFVPIAFTISLVIIGFLLVSFGLRLGEDQREAIEEYLHSNLDADRTKSC